ncbi:MAG TPA: TetR/AcrR family transcriptional regulator [Erythrobacter sp.]|nr:TetR/AcrR family transcriptional regulator [Erythrobacter sp.]
MSRDSLLPPMANFVLENGLAPASLRPLAKAAGTSDRMLIYHFGSKERLIEDLLEYIADIYADAIDQSFGGERVTTRQECLERVMAFTAKAEMQPFMALWWEIVAGATHNKPGYLEAGRSMIWLLLNWMKTQLPIDDPDPEGGARYLLTMIEGALMLRAVGCDEIARAGLGNADLGAA